MSYVALYRAYRPAKFSEVSGQEHIVKTLKNSIINNKVAHAYLFSGPRGTGKTSVAKIIAKAINCPNQQDGEPCCECPICLGIAKGSIPDVIEIDAASNNGVDEIRDIRDKVKYLPGECKYKVYIIDEVHMLSTGAFNALLKTLEEPPMHAIFILATTEVNKIPSTIISRCQRFDFKGVSVKDISDRIEMICQKENIEISKDAISLIAENADGGMRDALSVLDEAISYGGNKVTTKDVYEVSGNVDFDNLLLLVNNILAKDSSKVLETFDNIVESGKEIPRVCSDLIGFYRDVLLFKNGDKNKKAVFKKNDFIAISGRLSNERIYFYLNVLNEASNNMRYSNHKRTFLELALIKMSDYEEQYRIDNKEEIDKLKEIVSRLEKQIKGTPIINIPKEEPKEVVLKRDDSKEYVTIKMIEEIINNPDANMRKYYQNYIAGLNDDSPIISQIKNGNLVVCGNNKAIITMPSTVKCDMLMRYPSKKNILALLNQNTKYLDDYYAILDSDWEKITADFKLKRKGNQKVYLEPFDINVIYYKDEEKTKSMDDVAKAIFGDVLIEEEGN